MNRRVWGWREARAGSKVKGQARQKLGDRGMEFTFSLMGERERLNWKGWNTIRATEAWIQREKENDREKREMREEGNAENCIVYNKNATWQVGKKGEHADNLWVNRSEKADRQNILQQQQFPMFSYL